MERPEFERKTNVHQQASSHFFLLSTKPNLEGFDEYSNFNPIVINNTNYFMVWVEQSWHRSLSSLIISNMKLRTASFTPISTTIKINRQCIRHEIVTLSLIVEIKGPESWWIAKSITISRVVNQSKVNPQRPKGVVDWFWIDLPRVEEL